MNFNKRIISISIALLLSSSWLYAQEIHTVTRVIDGDTFEIDNGEIIRLIGVDTPETGNAKEPEEYYGKEAFEFMRKKMVGKSVRLEFDNEKKDKYGRTLAYVWLATFEYNEVLINEVLIISGLGHISFFPPNVKYLHRFTDSHILAFEIEHGIWDHEKRAESLGKNQAILTHVALNDKVISNLRNVTAWINSKK